MYRKDLANRILEALNEAFPEKSGLPQLKAVIPEFADLPHEEWFQAIDALTKEGLVECALVRVGFDQVLRAVANLELTAAGRQYARQAPQTPNAAPASDYGKEDKEKARRVFVIHGRDERLRTGMFGFLRSIGLEPLEWTKAIALTGKASPYIGEILKAAFNHALAVVALFSPDDEARLRGEFLKDDDPPHERELTGQARANVLFESGMALASHEDQTVLVQFGKVRPFTDVAGRHVVMMDNSVAKRQELATKLKNAGCAVDLDGTDWHTAGDLTPPIATGAQKGEAGVATGPAAEGGAIESAVIGEVELALKQLDDVEIEALKLLLVRPELTEKTAIEILRQKGILKQERMHVFHKIESVTGFVKRTGPTYESDLQLGYRGAWRVVSDLRAYFEGLSVPAASITSRPKPRGRPPGRATDQDHCRKVS